MKQLLEKLVSIPSVSGHEDAMRDYIKHEIADFFDSVETDALGNLICHKNGKGDARVLVTHMDCDGLIVTYCNGDNVKVAPLGSIKAQYAAYRRVEFFTGHRGLLLPPQSYNSETKISEFSVELGDVPEQEILLGTKAYFEDNLLSLEGDYVSGATLSSRAGIACLINAAKEAQFSDRNIYFIFTVQECLGGRGVSAALYGINTNEIYNFRAASLGKTALPDKAGVGNGAAINVMGKGFVTEPHLAQSVYKLCSDYGVKAVMFTDANAVSDSTFAGKSGAGCVLAEICIPVDNMGSAAEILKLSDMKNVCDVAKALVK